jgi:hypothetical protein
MAAARPVAAAAASPTPADILKSPAWPPEFPFGPDELSRYDEAPDSAFYSAPRFVTHIDDAAIGALTKYYGTVFPPSGSKDAALLDICSSWISHYPPVRLHRYARYIAGVVLTQNAHHLHRRGTLRGASLVWA